MISRKLRLKASALPTEAIGNAGEVGRSSDEELKALLEIPSTGPTDEDVIGPYFRAGAPFRAKVSPPLSVGIVLLVGGRVWGYDTRKPLAGSVVDIWQADARGHYDNQDPRHPPSPVEFVNRTRMLTDESGAYEFESIHPGSYWVDELKLWRSPHIHVMVRVAGYLTLVTQLFFKGDPHQKTDPFFKKSLMIALGRKRISASRSCEVGHFDIVLRPIPNSRPPGEKDREREHS